MKFTAAGWRRGWAIALASVFAITVAQSVSSGQPDKPGKGKGRGDPAPATPAVPATPATPRVAPATPAVPATPATPRIDPATPAVPATPATPRIDPATPATPAAPLPRTGREPAAAPAVGADVRAGVNAKPHPLDGDPNPNLRPSDRGSVRYSASWNKLNQDEQREFRTSMNGAFRSTTTTPAPAVTVRTPRTNDPTVRDDDRPSAAWLQSNPQRAQYWAGWGSGARTRFNTGSNVYFNNDWWTNRNMIGIGGVRVADRNTWWGYQPWAVKRPYTYWYGRPGWNSFTSWYGWSQPYYYDYGNGGNVVYRNNQVYVNGQLVGTPVVYSQSAAQLAAFDPSTVKISAEDWLPLGTFAIVTSEQDQAPIHVIQLAASKDALISGSMHNSQTDKSYTVQGRIDKETQRAAFTIGENHDLVLETGLYNLTQQEAPVLAHFGSDKTANYVFVRLPQPDQKGALEGNQPPVRTTAVPSLP